MYVLHYRGRAQTDPLILQSPYVRDCYPLKNSSAPRKTSKSKPFCFPDRPQAITDAYYAVDDHENRTILIQRMFKSKFLKESSVFELLNDWIQHGEQVNVTIATTVDDFRARTNAGFGQINRETIGKDLKFLARVFGFKLERTEVEMKLPELQDHGVSEMLKAVLPMVRCSLLFSMRFFLSLALTGCCEQGRIRPQSLLLSDSSVCRELCDRIDKTFRCDGDGGQFPFSSFSDAGSDAIALLGVDGCTLDRSVRRKTSPEFVKFRFSLFLLLLRSTPPPTLRHLHALPHHRIAYED